MVSESAQRRRRRRKVGEAFGWRSTQVVGQVRTPQVFEVLAAAVEVA